MSGVLSCNHVSNTDITVNKNVLQVVMCSYKILFQFQLQL